MFVGPSGVGKTETALALSELLYGGEENLITINMSEYQEAHTVSGLKGSPPGYVGYGEGGVLTEAVRQRPYSVVLLDEVEKAHPDVMELFYQVFDKGMLEDGEGREIDFKNTLIILTSNLGTDTIMKACADEETKPGPEALAEMLRPELVKRLQARLPGPAEGGAVLSHHGRDHAAHHQAQAEPHQEAHDGEQQGDPDSATRSWKQSPAAAPRWTAGRETWTTS